MHETFEHTADLGLRIRAADLQTLFVEAAQLAQSLHQPILGVLGAPEAAAIPGIPRIGDLHQFETIVADLATVQPRHQLEVHLSGEDNDYLLFDWLHELLYHFDSEHLLLGRFEVKIKQGNLSGIAWGEPLDRARHELEHEVKAITYHGLRVQQTPDGWLAEVIVDI